MLYPIKTEMKSLMTTNPMASHPSRKRAAISVNIPSPSPVFCSEGKPVLTRTPNCLCTPDSPRSPLLLHIHCFGLPTVNPKSNPLASLSLWRAYRLVRGRDKTSTSLTRDRRWAIRGTTNVINQVKDLITHTTPNPKSPNLDPAWGCTIFRKSRFEQFQ